MYCRIKYTALLLLFFIASFAQTDTTENSKWLSTITKNAIAKSANNHTFQNAPAGFALYFSKADTVTVPYLVFVPKNYNPGKPHTLVVYLHGGVVSINNFQYKNASFAVSEPVFAAADNHNCIVLYPYGRKDFGWVKQTAAFENIMTMIWQVEQTYNVDKKNIFLGGMSNGGTAAFWFITHQPQVFKAFFAFSAIPKLYHSTINFKNISAGKPLYSYNAKDDEIFSFDTVKAIYDQHKNEAPGWYFTAMETGNHGFIYDDSGTIIINQLFDKLNTANAPSKAILDSLTQVLFDIDDKDQQYRNQMDEVRTQFGATSKEIKDLRKNMKIADSINLIAVENIIDKWGWLGEKEIGSQANTALFMVIQHADLAVQEKYLPVMQQAVTDKKAKENELALLEDRVAVWEGKKQMYGSQLSWNLQTNTYFVLPLADPDHVDERRATVGLGLYADYLKDCCNLIWDAEQYKKDLPKIEAEFKREK